MTALHHLSLGELAIRRPSATRVLERYALDYCCGGNRSLLDACRERGLDAEQVLAEVESAAPEETPADWVELPPAQLARHLVDTHHRYLQGELPAVDQLAEKVRQVHGGRHPELHAVRHLVALLRADLEPHLRKEELILFPAIEALAAGHRQFAFGPIDNPIRMMLIEHDHAGELLEELRAATVAYRTPEDACASYGALYQRLEALEADTHLHVHKENNALFPAALRLAGT